MPIRPSERFGRIHRQGRSFHTEYFVAFFAFSAKHEIGVTASKKVGNAVCRNRAKRVIKASFLECMQGLDVGAYAIIAKPSILSAEYSDILRLMKKALSSVVSKNEPSELSKNSTRRYK